MNLVGELWDKAKRQGYVTSDDVVGLLTESQGDPDQVEAALLVLRDAGIQVHGDGSDGTDEADGFELVEAEGDGPGGTRSTLAAFPQTTLLASTSRRWRGSLCLRPRRKSS